MAHLGHPWQREAFGSDFPLWNPDDAIAGLFDLTTLRAGNLPYVEPATVEQILEQDSLKLLGLSV